MTTSAIGNAIDWLVGAAQAGITPVGTETQQVYITDGPPATQDYLVRPQRIGIGLNLLDPAHPAAEGEQEFGAINQARTRYETFMIVCSAEEWSGDTNLKPRRQTVFALMAQMELLIRGVNGNPGDTTMGGAVMYSQIGGPISFDYRQDPSGASAVLVFHIAAKARLTT